MFSPYVLTAIAALAATLALYVAGVHGWMGVPAIVMFASLAMHLRRREETQGYSFTLWVFAFVSASLFYPWLFRSWNGFPLSRIIVPLIQVIMFGMGTSLSVADFARVILMPRPVFICMFLQFTIMPLTGFVLARLFGFEGQVAAGVILIGACSAGVASNVMVYLARGSIALSVTMTTCSTLLAPVMTPLAMKVLAGQYVPISFVDMMIEILYMIIVPIAAGLLFNKLFHGRIGWLDRVLPVVSMAAICLIIAIITAISRDKLLEVGFLLILAAVLHNTIGYVLGYTGARAFGLDEVVARTVAFEVGLQNGGMASGLAINVLKSADAALAPAVFGPWMNISGSALASYWRGKPVAGSTVAPESGIAAKQ
jgi:BASS family bile acid:Na+ symporter